MKNTLCDPNDVDFDDDEDDIDFKDSDEKL